LLRTPKAARPSAKSRGVYFFNHPDQPKARYIFNIENKSGYRIQNNPKLPQKQNSPEQIKQITQPPINFGVSNKSTPKTNPTK